MPDQVVTNADIAQTVRLYMTKLGEEMLSQTTVLSDQLQALRKEIEGQTSEIDQLNQLVRKLAGPQPEPEPLKTLMRFTFEAYHVKPGGHVFFSEDSMRGIRDAIEDVNQDEMPDWSAVERDTALQFVAEYMKGLHEKHAPVIYLTWHDSNQNKYEFVVEIITINQDPESQ